MIFPGDFVSLTSDAIAGQQLEDLEKRVPWLQKYRLLIFIPEIIHQQKPAATRIFV